MKNDVESTQYDIGTTHVRLIRVGNVIQILFSSSREPDIFTRNWQQDINEPKTD